MEVAILGCGPSGLIAAHACNRAGANASVFSTKRKSHLFGSQYLHEPIPGITNHYDQGEHVKYIVRGTPEEYRQKTHGKWWDGQVAPEEFEPDHTAWNIRSAYDTLWQHYGSEVIDYTIPKNVGGRLAFERVKHDLQIDNYDLVINTMPRSIWSIDGETFTWSEGWAIGDAPEMGVFVDRMFSGGVENNTIVCDGTSDVSWTRLSKVFGYTSVEWPHHATKPPIVGVSQVTKPLSWNASPLNPTNDWLHVGRYGKWKKGYVVTDAFHQVTKKLLEMK